MIIMHVNYILGAIELELVVKELNKDNINDLPRICCENIEIKPILREGIRIKKEWLAKFIDRYGSVAKIAYIEDIPVAQILYYPEASIPYIVNPRSDVAWIQCIYNPFREYQRMGIAKRLVNDVISDCVNGVIFRGLYYIRNLIVKPFDIGMYYSQKAFFSRMGFKPLGEGELYYNIFGEPPAKLTPCKYDFNRDDIGKAYIFYSPTCEFSIYFAYKIRDIIYTISGRLGLDIDIIIRDKWMDPHLFIGKGCNDLIINGRPIKESFFDENFEMKVEAALKSV